MLIKISVNEKGNPPGKLAEAELYFDEGDLKGMKLVGFGVWDRRNGTGRSITFPSRPYGVGVDRRSFTLLRPATDIGAQERLREAILQAYVNFEAEASVAR